MYTISDICEVIEEENLSYAITEGISPSRIKDETLAEMWEEARDLLIRIEEYLDTHAGEDEDEDEDEDWED